MVSGYWLWRPFMSTAMVVIRCVCLVGEVAGEVVVDEEIGEPRHYRL